MIIGLISDTHIPEAGKELPPQVYQALEGVDLILHGGDMHDPQVLDWLETIAPVMAARGNGDISRGPNSLVHDDPRIKQTQVLEVDGLKIGMVHDFPLPNDAPWLSFEGFMDSLFDGRMDIVICGHTHVPHVTHHQSTIIINSGSPTMPNNVYGKLGTMAILDTNGGAPLAEIIQLK